jgi:hypothetical protein
MDANPETVLTTRSKKKVSDVRLPALGLLVTNAGMAHTCILLRIARLDRA